MQPGERAQPAHRFRVRGRESARHALGARPPRGKLGGGNHGLPGAAGDERRDQVRVELQADCFAGVWAHSAGSRNLLDRGDLEEGLTAASAIGDDRLQKQAQGYVVPESFTHGSSAQRVRWFKRGMDSGRPKDCDTFAAASL